MIRCDKTFSELWNLTESKDLLVAEAARMAIKTIEEFQAENRKQRQEIEQLKKSGIDLNNDLFHERTEKERLMQEIEKQQQEIEALTNLKKTLEEANHGMQEKIQEQEQKIEMLLKENNVIYAKFLTIDHFIEETRREVKKL